MTPLSKAATRRRTPNNPGLVASRVRAHRLGMSLVRLPPLRLFACLVCCGISIARAADPAIARVWAEWRSAESFERISEYFGRSENTGGRRILRTHADQREGFYFLVDLTHAAALTDEKVEVQVITPDRPEPKTFTFPASAGLKENVFELGLTGADWPGGEKVRPVAWRVALLAADGHVLAEQKSFLWENPAK